MGFDLRMYFCVSINMSNSSTSEYSSCFCHYVWNRSVTIQLSLPATAKVEAGSFGLTATSIQSFGEGQFNLIQWVFW